MMKKICVICEICVTKKRPKKNLCIFVKSVGLFTTSGGIFSSWEGLVPQISQIYTDFFESLVNRFVRSQGVSATTGQVASAKFRVIR